MRLTPEASKGRYLALALLLAAVLIGYLLGVHWWFVAPHLDYAGQMSDLREQQLKFRETTAQRPQIERQLAEVLTFEKNNQAFLTDADANSAFSSLTQKLTQVVTMRAADATRCSISSKQPINLAQEELYLRVIAQVRMRCDMETFAHIVYDLENSNPYLFVDQLAIFKQAGGGGAAFVANSGGKSTVVGASLDIRFNLSGYLRQPGKKPEVKPQGGGKRSE